MGRVNRRLGCYWRFRYVGRLYHRRRLRWARMKGWLYVGRVFRWEFRGIFWRRTVGYSKRIEQISSQV